MLDENSEDNIFKYFSYISQKICLTFHAVCLLRRRQTAWDVKPIFWKKNKKNVSLSFDELAQRMVKVNKFYLVQLSQLSMM